MTYVIGVIVAILILGLIVLLHEGGHFIMAKRAGIMCYEFAIGMGPVLYQWRKGETVYSIRAIPIGGFVSMAGEEIESNMLTGYSKCQLVLDNGKVSRIIVDEKQFNTEEVIYKIVKNDLIGSKEAKEDELYIDVLKGEEELHFIVKRNAVVHFPKKQTYQIAPYERNFVNKPIGARFLAVFAGPAMNFVLALVVYFILGLCRGYIDPNVTFVDNIIKDTPAYEAGLRDGDEILYIGTLDFEDVTSDMYFDKWDDISKALLSCANGENKDYQGYVNIVYKRDNKILETTAYPNSFINTIGIAFENSKENNNSLIINNSTISGVEKGDILVSVNGIEFKNRGEALAYFYSEASQEKFKYEVVIEKEDAIKTYEVDGFSLEVLEDNDIAPSKVQIEFSAEYQRNFLKNLYMPFVETADASMLVFRTLKALFADKSVGISDLSGPIGIFQATATIVDVRDAEGKFDLGGSIISILSWIGMLTVNIGLLNIVPIPALDGGRLAFIAYEAITRKKPNAKFENTIHTIGFFLLMALFVVVAFNDILRIFGI